MLYGRWETTTETRSQELPKSVGHMQCASIERERIYEITRGVINFP